MISHDGYRCRNAHGILDATFGWWLLAGLIVTGLIVAGLARPTWADEPLSESFFDETDYSSTPAKPSTGAGDPLAVRKFEGEMATLSATIEALQSWDIAFGACPASTVANIKLRAHQGDAVSQDWVGSMYLNGHCVPQDFVRAAEWYGKSAEQDNADAQFSLAYMYETGRGVPQDYELAVHWHTRSAHNNDLRSQFRLGVLYYYGQGVPQNFAAAANWTRKAAEKGSPQAQVLLGAMYARGEGLSQNLVEAHKLLNLGAARLPSGKEREATIASREAIAGKMTPSEIALAQQLARDWQVAAQ